MINKPHSRRRFLKNAGIATVGFAGLQTFLASCTSNGVIKTKPNAFEKYGPLKKDPNGIINLPKGFKYRIIAKTGDKMSDGFFHPDKPDGMATFQGSNGKVILIRNHELMPKDFSAFGENNELLSSCPASKIYDAGDGVIYGTGGTTTLIFDEDVLQVEKSFLSLAGTLRNCAGGPTPWNSWLTCEEVFTNVEKGLQAPHGYVFEVPATESPELADPVPIKALGKFNHEAVAVDPGTGIVYLTEDAHDGLIYRFIPNEYGNLIAGGKLQALVITGLDTKDTSNWGLEDVTPFPINKRIEVSWIDMDDIDSVKDDLRIRGYEKGAARFSRGEGMWFGNGEVWFACTSGGKNKTGQVFKYIPSIAEGTKDESKQPGMLELFLEPNDSSLLRYCDNLTVAPWGDVIMCEDNEHPFLVGVTPKGQLYKLAENIGFESEFAGGVFSPSGKTYFVNIQHAGLTLAIQGPWERGEPG